MKSEMKRKHMKSMLPQHPASQAPNHPPSGVMAIDTSSRLCSHWKPLKNSTQINSNLHITPYRGWQTMYGLMPQTNKSNVNLNFHQPQELLFQSLWYVRVT